MASWSVVRELPLARWQDFLEREEHANIYHTPEMVQVFARVPGHTAHVWAAVDATGTPAALFTPVLITLRGGLLRGWTTRAVAYGGFLAEEGQRGMDALAALLHAYREQVRVPLFTELRHMHDPSPWQDVLRASGYRWEPHLNFLLPLHEGEDALWRRLNRTARKNVRKAEREGVTVRAVERREDVAVCYDFLSQVYTRARIPLAPRELFFAAFDILVPRKMAYFWLAYHEGHPIATRITLAYKGTLVDWYGGAASAARNLRPDDYLVWHVLRWGAAQGYHTFDFGGAGHPDTHHGIRRFKAKFGGDQVNYGRSTYVHHPWRLRLSQWAYEKWRRMGSR